MLNQIKANAAAARLLDEKIHAQVLREMEAGQRHDGAWAKALSAANGSESAAKALYIRFRAQSIKDEITLQSTSNNSGSGLQQIIFRPDIKTSEKAGHIAAHFVKYWIPYSLILLVIVGISQ